MHYSDFNDVKMITGWLAALCSGKYEKIQMSFKKGNQFCVQGVILDQLQRSNLGEWALVGAEYRFHYQGSEIEYDEYYITAPEIAERLNLYEKITAEDFEQDVWPKYKETISIREYVMFMNDDTDLSFPEMANVLYDIYQTLGISLPPKESIKEVAENGECEDSPGNYIERSFEFFDES